MWLMVIFDLPVTTREYRRAYQQFRGLLLDEGFWQLQYSVYARVAFNEERAETLKRKIDRPSSSRFFNPSRQKSEPDPRGDQVQRSVSERSLSANPNM